MSFSVCPERIMSHVAVPPNLPVFWRRAVMAGEGPIPIMVGSTPITE
jgi:hypothetical protein